MIKVELHAHTRETSFCGKLSAVSLIQKCAGAGYGMVVITDHLWDGWRADKPLDARVADYLKGYRAAKARGEKCGVHVLLGIEARLAWIGSEDFLVYGPSEADIPEIMRLIDTAPSILALKEGLNGMGLLFVQAHPFRPGLEPVPAAWLDGMEVYNGNPRHDSGNDKAVRYAQTGGLIETSGSDAHQSEDIGRGGIYVPEWVTDNASLVRFLRETRQPKRIVT